MRILADKTIKELADELGVSKDKIKYQARKLPSNFTYLKDVAISAIYDNLDIKKTGDIPQFLPNDYLLSELQKKEDYLKAKDLQIAEKDQQLANM